MIDTAAAHADGAALAALDAATRLVHTLVEAGGVRPGAEAQRLVNACVQRCLARPDERLQAVPAVYWSVLPEADGPEGQQRLRLRGAVVLRLPGRRAEDATHGAAAASPMAPELAAALRERAEPVWRTVWRHLREDGRATPWALALAVGLTTCAVALELLLFRGLFDLSSQLVGSGQRLGAAAALLAVLVLLPLLEWPTAREVIRLGRHLELRLRAALLERLPRLHDRYFPEPAHL